MARTKTAIFDVETNGLLHQLNKVTCLVIYDLERKKTFRYRNNDEMNNIALGVKRLTRSKTLVGHNIIGFDLKAIEKVYPDFEPEGKIKDTLVLARMLFANIKESDFKLFKRKQIPGYMIGKHSLDSWGYRLGKHKGDYKKEREAEAKEKGIFGKDELVEYVWGTWNQSLEDYCVNDVEVTTLLWKKITKEHYVKDAVVLEHQIHDRMEVQSKNGIPFDVERATKLSDAIDEELSVYMEKASIHFGKWFAPAKKWQVKSLWNNIVAKKKKYMIPRKEFGEDDSRAIWADVRIPKRDLSYKDPMKPSRRANAPFSPITLKEFNPKSRDQIIDRFGIVYQWEPDDFTETGRPSVNDEVLRNLIGKIPMAEVLADIFYLMKKLSQIRDGKEAWLKHIDDEGFIHHYVNVGGTITSRASHSRPNLGQVPKVKIKEWKDKNGKKHSKILKGRKGDYGWECRSLFHAPEGFVMIGCDLSGMQFRCLANLTSEFDGGQLIKLIMDDDLDIHTFNQEAAGLKTRDNAKTTLYALIFGGGDEKLGSITEPLWSEAKKRALGKQIRADIMKHLPGLKKATMMIQKQFRRGWIQGLDGRRLTPRNEYSALNVRLQSDEAILAKWWNVRFAEAMEDNGFIEGLDSDWIQMLWVHDEIQFATRPEIADIASELIIKAANNAGIHFKFALPVDAKAKIGQHWAETH